VKGPVKGPASERSNAIDALRGAAALAVVLYHARGLFFIGGTRALAHGLHLDLGTLQALVVQPLAYGWLGVELFFVLSGYCIHRSEARRLAKDPSHRLAVGTFALRRIWRIYPTYVCALVLSAAADVFLVLRGMRQPGEIPNSWWTFAASVSSLQGYVAPQFSSNQVFWTLSVELHLYAAYPLLHWISRRWGPGRALLVPAIASAAYVAVDLVLGLARFFPFRSVNGPVFIPFWFTWAVGMYLAECEVGRAALPRSWKWLGWGGAAVGAVMVALGRLGVAELGWAVAFGGLVQWGVSPKGASALAGIFGRALSRLGLFSYSIYAIHVPVLLFLAGWVTPHWEKSANIGLMLLATMAAIPAAWICFQVVERWSLIWPILGERTPPARPQVES
jgi:peptidoglycan/LPS O-acetylase OafA/YrhL